MPVPTPNFLADPRRGSPHSRGAAVDLTLLDGAGRELDMGTPFDAFTPLSHHANTEISVEAQRNRFILLGLDERRRAGISTATSGGTISCSMPRQYPLLGDADLPTPMM